MGSKRKLLVNGESYEVEILSQDRDSVRFALGDRIYQVGFEDAVPQTAITAPKKKAEPRLSAPVTRSAEGEALVSAPMPGVVLEVLVQVGAEVQVGDVLLRIEAMKMENNIFSPCAGTVLGIEVSGGDEVRDGQGLVRIKAS